jgi:hypothetical protein
LTDVEVGGVLNAKHCITHFASCTCSPDMRAQFKSMPAPAYAKRLYRARRTPSGATSSAFATLWRDRFCIQKYDESEPRPTAFRNRLFACRITKTPDSQLKTTVSFKA